MERKNKIVCGVGLRLPTSNKPYYKHQLEQFCDSFNDKKIKAIEFGKQDTRGSDSITFLDYRDCVPHSIHFYNKYEMLGFVCGFNQRKELQERFKE